MSDFWVSSSEKPRKLQVKLAPIHVEAINTRLSIRRNACNLLLDTAEKMFPQVTYDDDVIEKLHAAGTSEVGELDAQESANASQGKREMTVTTTSAKIEEAERRMIGREMAKTALKEAA